MPEQVLSSWLTLLRVALPLSRKLVLARHIPGLSGSERSRDDASSLPLTAQERVLFDSIKLAEAVESDLRRLGDEGIRPLSLNCVDYPPLLAQISRPPLVLFVRGSTRVLTEPQIAVVGSRNATQQGLETAGDFAGRLARTGFTITSGLALGVDGAAHEGCLDAGGRAVAVLATGPERVYPARHQQLAERIVASAGALVTEFPPGEPPRPRNFPRRNRIISGLGRGTLVVEAAVRSGSLITARYALEQNREVFAIPGSIHNPASRGCHQLIRQGAKLVEQVDDILEELDWLGSAGGAVEESAEPPVVQHDLSVETRRVLEGVDFGPTDFDTIVRRSQREAQTVLTTLMDLELRGLVCKSAGFFIRRKGAAR
jgi:DNA processing protein